MSILKQLGGAVTEGKKERTVSRGSHPKILTDIYQEETNMVIWQRILSSTLTAQVSEILLSNAPLQIVKGVTPKSVLFDMQQELGGLDCAKELTENIAELVDMFCCLFELKRAGLRLTKLQHPMCPRFHFDRVPCRLVTTYGGIGSQWLPHQLVDRCKLGAGNQGLSDELSGLYKNASNIKQLDCADVALLKGESWHGNENAGLVHRSPAMHSAEKRLLLTLDFLA
ncbi:MAG: DUF1826 domain-containing protein [Oceanospirillaceae bacterium]